jgi:hypothetical protein
MKVLKDFVGRLTSRKFLVTLGLIVAFAFFPDLANNDAVLTLAVSYLGVEGLKDFIAAWRNVDADVKRLDLQKAKVESGYPLDDDRSDNKIVPGLPHGLQ